jgi:hypothetical protein
MPSEEELKAIAEKTMAVLGGVIDGKVAAATQKNIQKQSSEPTFIRYF